MERLRTSQLSASGKDSEFRSPGRGGAGSSRESDLYVDPQGVLWPRCNALFVLALIGGTQLSLQCSEAGLSCDSPSAGLRFRRAACSEFDRKVRKKSRNAASVAARSNQSPALRGEFKLERLALTKAGKENCSLDTFQMSDGANFNGRDGAPRNPQDLLRLALIPPP